MKQLKYNYYDNLYIISWNSEDITERATADIYNAQGEHIKTKKKTIRHDYKTNNNYVKIANRKVYFPI